MATTVSYKNLLLIEDPLNPGSPLANCSGLGGDLIQDNFKYIADVLYAATDANTVSTIVKRDSSGNFSATTGTFSTSVKTPLYTSDGTADVSLVPGFRTGGGGRNLKLTGGTGTTATSNGYVSIFALTNPVVTVQPINGIAADPALGFFNVGPVVQQVQTTDLKDALVNYGLINSSAGATPLNLDGGTITADGSGLTGLSASNISSGTLAVTRGGTGTGTAFTTGSVVFAGSSGVYSQDNAKFFWDDTNNRLGVGTASPAALLDLSNATASDAMIKLKGASSQSGNYLTIVNSSSVDVAHLTSGGALFLDTILLELNTFGGHPFIRSNTGRLDFYASNYVVFHTSSTSFDSQFAILYDGATFVDANGQRNSYLLDFQSINWTGSTVEYGDFYLQAKQYPSGTNNQYFSITGRNLGGYSGDSFVVQSIDWRTNTKSGNIGINNSNPSAHLHITEDDSSRVLIKLDTAASQSGSVLELYDSSSTLRLGLDSTGNQTWYDSSYGSCHTAITPYGITLDLGSAPAPGTSYTIYQSGGNLYYFDGSTTWTLNQTLYAPGGSANDVQFNGGGFFSGGGPTWDGSTLSNMAYVNATTSYQISGTQVVASQQSAIADDPGGTSDPFDRTIGNTILAALRAHGLIAT